MPAKTIIPPADARLASTGGVDLYLLPLQEQFPLYRDIKLIAVRPLFLSRRVARLSWIIHEARFRRGGDAWKLTQHNPDVLTWAEKECAADLTLDYVRETFDFSADDLAQLVAAERAKYSA
jgi:hypothetical protein